MRLLIALPDPCLARRVRFRMEEQLWNVELIPDGRTLSRRDAGEDLWLLHDCLPGLDGRTVGDRLAANAPLCPPRILFICPGALTQERPAWADCMVEAGVSVEGLCALLSLLAKKPLPNLAAARKQDVARAVALFLDALALDEHLKGRAYAQWLLQHMVPSPLASSRPLRELYAACAQAFHTSASAVERCLRVAVESVFTQGSLRGIERFFGATVDPERGKPTNRAFLLQASQQLRLELGHSFAAARSPNSIEMHHSPAAPTTV